MSETAGRSPAAVPERQAQDRRAGEVEPPKAEPARSSTKPPVWTARMLATLARGISGGKWNGADHMRWPIAFFDGHGLISLQGARIAARQSSRR